ncbi:MAG TPA: ATP-binding protein [Blastocatellia bacterium]|nr:ATP-binding protein [Blastocatellia bacterium]
MIKRNKGGWIIQSAVVLASSITLLLNDANVTAEINLPIEPGVGFAALPPVWRRWWFIALVGGLAGLAVIAFERYRAARLKELQAALSESEELAEQLTIQQLELGKATRVLALDYAVTRALVETASPVEAALAILQTICVATAWDFGAIWEVDPRSEVARCVGVWQKPIAGAAKFEAVSRNHAFLPCAGLPGRVLASRKPQWITDIVEYGSLPRLITAAKKDLRSAFGFPILAGNEVIGVLGLYSYEIRQPDEELMQITSSTGSHVGQLIQRKRAEEELSRSKEERLLELERVRKRIATDLHDDVGSSLTKIALLSEAVRQKVAEMNKDISDRLTAVTVISNELMEAMSDIVWAINPQKDYLSDLSQRMRRYASDIFTACQISFRFRAPALEQDIQLGANIRREVFLIFKETVNNAVRHSECSEVVLDLSVEGDWIVLSINDNGKGFNPALVKASTGFLTSQHRGGNGLASMRRRAREMGGQFDIKTSAGRGARMTLKLPIGCGVSGAYEAAIHAGGDKPASL